MREDRRFDILWRIWPGTQRLLLWADPVFAAGYARAFQFCGSSGVEIMEPLSFKGRRGSGRMPSGPGGRCAYADASLRPRWDWEKYLDTYRVWGRKLYNPDAKVAVEPSLAAASRILPIVTTAHLPSAANNNYWPEIYIASGAGSSTTRMPRSQSSLRSPPPVAFCRSSLPRIYPRPRTTTTGLRSISRLGPEALQPGCQGRSRAFARRRQSHSADRHYRASTLGREQQLLA